MHQTARLPGLGGKFTSCSAGGAVSLPACVGSSINLHPARTLEGPTPPVNAHICPAVSQTQSPVRSRWVGRREPPNIRMLPPGGQGRILV